MLVKKKLVERLIYKNFSSRPLLVDHVEFIQYRVIIRLLVLQNNRFATGGLKSTESP